MSEILKVSEITFQAILNATAQFDLAFTTSKENQRLSTVLQNSNPLYIPRIRMTTEKIF
ncbi:21453_t:CDS:2 [Rhizophagus irregularis]|uniref:Uncharacterized protein n=1 Tax=Rhizophagus irregularis (strain DAOM 181602 / DAOM 197198 / MUCL 43194) TaxID=747089 RepID=U9T4C2_RHIID|nr:21453_t:CDS:2 [Rhizophagus irregularis]